MTEKKLAGPGRYIRALGNSELRGSPALARDPLHSPLQPNALVKVDGHGTLPGIFVPKKEELGPGAVWL